MLPRGGSQCPMLGFLDKNSLACHLEFWEFFRTKGIFWNCFGKATPILLLICRGQSCSCFLERRVCFFRPLVFNTVLQTDWGAVCTEPTWHPRV